METEQTWNVADDKQIVFVHSDRCCAELVAGAFSFRQHVRRLTRTHVT
jgi:hypothetical protein